ncbi:TetR/AcrR family transcriptional regulator [Rhizobium ruizarguesonis]|uniref:TetR/AcrR family transcriptional regulator n=1 Tax=Rhizobium ruizarguesonis TaxID=2081791 RepID=UPI001031DC3E|nr:TetR/AcrR family transcriptional regulator [Rhizobium ruizarguesonis]TCA63239.1 TetR/AcrR family transcriptional regulator [Rhizobium leguminosarum bv. viciae]NEJ98234.1 TetR family transcriptional regulator [Rhizobium ruizarguesonis]TBD36712.1 TetR/AcrR family transcriptional regulator [Rhizobium ruizarguesonis]TBD41481.1 TetR/AcrR family transcriptional regulator [Rhizobium ruizarguesonis]TBD57822.1 TetR/AcrR family transcriptional regulator [Rhizobium ruizarguesonis]
MKLRDGMARKRSETMQENRVKLIAAARKAFAEKGYSAASMDELTADVGLTRGALYHNFQDKRGLLAAVVDQIDTEMAVRAQEIGAGAGNDWQGLLAEGAAYIEMALNPEVQRIVLLDGPAVLGDPSQWPSQNNCLQVTKSTVGRLIAQGILKPLDPEAAARLLSGAALNAALWIAASEDPQSVLPKAVEAFHALAAGLLVQRL